MTDLVACSLKVLTDGQGPTGAYVACSTYPTYRYCWFRDGTFVAAALERWGEQSSATRFYSWAAHTVVARRDAVERCIAAAAARRRPDPADVLHTRYTLDGQPGSEEWPNFQLDGFGTVLWGLARQREDNAATVGAPALWGHAMRLLVRYLAALWRQPNADCWEEFPDRIAVSTLAVLYAGLHAAADTLGTGDEVGRLAGDTAGQIRALVLAQGTYQGHLIKQIDGEDVVDASLLWAAVPFGYHALLAPTEPIMRATAARIVTDLTGATGGIHRYRADTFYGGGEWMLLTALLGEYEAAVGDWESAQRRRLYIERHADAAGQLPEQSTAAPLAPNYVAEWVQRWGTVARPLLWSHASYLSLCAALKAGAHQSSPS